MFLKVKERNGNGYHDYVIIKVADDVFHENLNEKDENSDTMLALHVVLENKECLVRVNFALLEKAKLEKGFTGKVGKAVTFIGTL